MIRKYVYIILLIGFIYSCKSKDVSMMEKIQGDWVSDVAHDGKHDNRYVFSFEDTLCSYMYAWGEYTRFYIKGDTLSIKEGRNYFFNTLAAKKTYSFKILALTEDSLVISPCTKLENELFEVFNVPTKKLILHKIKEKNKIKPIRISFSSSRCFGDCPEMMLEIDSNRAVLFEGQYSTDKIGSYKGFISTHEYELLLNKISILPIDSIKREYTPFQADGQVYVVFIDYKNKSLQSFVSGSDKVPIELSILVHKLMELYKRIELKKDSIQPTDFKHYEMLKAVSPPMIPPPPLFYK